MVKGEEKGRSAEREKLARKLLAITEFSLEKIAELVDVPLAQVKALSRIVRNK